MRTEVFFKVQLMFYFGRFHIVRGMVEKRAWIFLTHEEVRMKNFYHKKLNFRLSQEDSFSSNLVRI